MWQLNIHRLIKDNLFLKIQSHWKWLKNLKIRTKKKLLKIILNSIMWPSILNYFGILPHNKNAWINVDFCSNCKYIIVIKHIISMLLHILEKCIMCGPLYFFSANISVLINIKKTGSVTLYKRIWINSGL